MGNAAMPLVTWFLMMRNERWKHNVHVKGANISTIDLNANCSIGRIMESPA